MPASDSPASVERVALRTPTLPPATHTNCYLLGRDALTLVDPATPWDDQREALAEALDARSAPVERVFLTHHHLDHVGAAAWVRQRYGVPVVAHARTRALLEGQLVVDELLDEGDTLDAGGEPWRVLHTPGHASGHLCLFDGQQVIAGDMVAGVGTIVLDPPEGDLGQYLDSLARLRDLAPRRLWPAHGPAIEDAVGLLEHYIAHRHQRTAQVRAALATTGGGGPSDLVPHIYPDLPPMARPIAARQVLCHLQWLAGRGAVSKRERTWTLAEGAAP